MIRGRHFLPLALSLWGCEGDKLGETGDELPVSPCADGSWGDLDSPTTAVQVRADGDDSGDGSLDAPVASLDAALALTRARSEDRTIFVGPGTYTVSDLTLESAPAAGGSDDGLVIDACSGEVTLEAGDPDAPVIRVSGAQDVSLAHLTLSGGTRSLLVWKGAKARVSSVLVKGGVIAGVVIGGHDTLVDMTDLNIQDSEGDGDGLGGFGLGISGATVRWSRGGVSKARVAGVFIDSDARDGGVTLEDLDVSGVSADSDGAYGRGIQAQDAASLTMSGCTVSDTQDAGVFVLQATSLVLEGVTVDTVSAGLVPDSEESSGDGVVITSLDDSGDVLDPDGFSATLTDTTVSGVARAAVLLEGVTATADGSALSGGTNGLVVQGDAALTGGDAEDAEDLNASPLGLNRVLLEGTDLTP